MRVDIQEKAYKNGLFSENQTVWNCKKLEKDSDESVVEKWLENHLPGLCV